MKSAVGAAVLGAFVLAASACGSGSGHASSNVQVRVRATRVIESRLIEDGSVRCTASVLTAPVQAGAPLGKRRVTFQFHNLSKRKVDVFEENGSALVRSPDGTRYDPLWESEHSPGGVLVPTSLAPGGTFRSHVFLPRVSWEGPLRITPTCEGTPMRPVRVAVTSPGLPTSRRAALNAVLAKTGHLLDRCRPQAPGVPVVGEVVPRTGRLRPFRARCSVSLRREGNFYRAQVVVVTPSDLRPVRVRPTYYYVRGPVVRRRNTQLIGWEFVVTRRGATLSPPTSR